MPLTCIRLLDAIGTCSLRWAVAAAVFTGSLALAQSSRPADSPATRPAEAVQAQFDQALLAYLQRPEERWIVSFPVNFKQEFASPVEEYSPASLLRHLRANPKTMCAAIKCLAQGSDKIRPLTPELLGMHRADLEYAMGVGEIELYGLILGTVCFDAEYGLPRVLMGCSSFGSQSEEADAHNRRLKELAAWKGPPAKWRELQARSRKAQRFREQRPTLDWVTLNSTLTEPERLVGSVSLFHRLKAYGDWQGLHLRTPSAESAEPVCMVEGEAEAASVQVAYWAAADTLVLRDRRADRFHFLDPGSLKTLWVFDPELEAMLQKLDASHPVSQPTR